MIEVAQRLSPVTGAAGEWRQGDVFALPVPGTSFDMAFCQQGLQFFPDKLAALKEKGRVLASGGSIILNAWSGKPLRCCHCRAFDLYVSAQAAKSLQRPIRFVIPKSPIR